VPVSIGRKADHGFDEPLGLLSDCHRRIEHFLGVLVKLGASAGAQLDDPARSALDNALRYFREAAPRHTADEESSVFPRLREVQSVEVRQAIGQLDRLEADHRLAESLHAEAELIGRRWLENGRLDPPVGARFREIVAELSATYAAHIEVEDSLLFPLAGKVLSRDTLAVIGREMATRRKVRS
jgi:hemerythrin-like domain-containing protein